MQRLIYYIIVSLAFCTSVLSQKLLYHSEAFTLNQNAVYEGNYEAGAISEFEIKSNYESTFRKGTKKVVDFKFSINGFDNERAPSQAHHILLEPEDGFFETPVFTFAEDDADEVELPDEDELYFSNDRKIAVLFKVDMRKVLNDFSEKGFYQTYDGSVISKNEFKHLYIAGSEPPLSWDFDSKIFELTDADNDSIYEIHITFDSKPNRPVNAEGYSEWKLSENILNYPQLNSPHTIINALYNLSLEELYLDIRPDSVFMAGAKWPGVWTRDISYSIVLALAMIDPEVAKKSLLAKVKDSKIIQDTGTGGSWPISSDRMIWAIAAWEVYLVTGDKDWLEKSYTIIKKTAVDDLNSLIDSPTGLFYGESSFLDWREQSYPEWMEPVDIFTSLNLGTNAVHYQTYRILAQMAQILGESVEEYSRISASIKNAMNTYFWMAGKGYFGQFLYGRNYKVLSPRSETLGEALCVLFDIAEESQQKKIIENMPVLEYGAPCIYPQISDVPSYHNNGIWPFVQTFWTLAAAKVGNERGVQFGLATLYRAAALFLTNKENMVASTGNFNGTEINSDRQLWSVAGSLATVYRIFFGIHFLNDSISFKPYVPESFRGTYELKNFKYRNSVLDIIVEGFGNKIDTVYFDNKPVYRAVFHSAITGNHTIKIILNNSSSSSSRINIVKNQFIQEIKKFELEDGELSWEDVENNSVYTVYKNGKLLKVLNDTEFETTKTDETSEYQVLAVDSRGYSSFLTEPLRDSGDKQLFIYQPDKFRNKIHVAYEGFTGNGYIPMTITQNVSVTFSFQVENPGLYSIDFRYANGNGPLNTDNKCAIRTLSVDEVKQGVVVFPQRGKHLWTDWGYSNCSRVYLSRGEHIIKLEYKDFNRNMNGDENVAFLDHLRLRMLSSEN